jgi:hypothetical protein
MAERRLYVTDQCLTGYRTIEAARSFGNYGGMLLPAHSARAEATVRCTCGRHAEFEGRTVRFSDDGLQSLYAAEVV